MNSDSDTLTNACIEASCWNKSSASSQTIRNRFNYWRIYRKVVSRQGTGLGGIQPYLIDQQWPSLGAVQFHHRRGGSIIEENTHHDIIRAVLDRYQGIPITSVEANIIAAIASTSGYHTMYPLVLRSNSEPIHE